MKKYWLVLITCIIPIANFAQQDAWVYLKDKQNVSSSLANPNTILTEKAIDRKTAHGVVIDERDVPVNENYIAQLKAQTGILVLAKSKWFNAVHVRGTQSDINALLNLSFVSSVDFADKSLNTSKSVQQKKETKFQEIFTDLTYGNALNQIKMFNGDQLHVDGYTGSGITIAVLDAGFPNVNTMSSFQRLRDAGHILDDYDFVNRDDDVFTNTVSNHGTLVLSTMAGYVDNQFVGTAPDASYYLFITEDGARENPVEESYWVEAAERADSLGVNIINSSLGYGSFYDNPNYNYQASEYDGYTAYITKGANIAFEKGLLIVNSAGNEGNSSGYNGVNAPADSPNVFSIGAVDASGFYAYFSSLGNNYQPTQKPDVVTQGLNSCVIFQNDAIGYASGTSFSSPIMAGGLACLWQALPYKTNTEIMKLVRESASQYGSPDFYLGYGIPNLKLSLNKALKTKDEIKVFPNPTNEYLFFKFSSSNVEFLVQVYDILGKRLLDLDLSNKLKMIDFSFFSKGIYIVKIQSNDISKTFKIIKD